MPLLLLNQPVANGLNNDPEDVRNLERALRGIGALTADEDAGSNEVVTPDISDAVRTLQEREGLRVDGLINPEGETEQTINNKLLRRPRGAGFLFSAHSPIGGAVGNGQKNRPEDITELKRRMGALGLIPEDPFDAPSGFIDASTDTAVRSFQERNGLKSDGVIKPDGPTDNALANEFSRFLKTSLTDLEDFAYEQAAAIRMLQNGQARSTPGVDGSDYLEGINDLPFITRLLDEEGPHKHKTEMLSPWVGSGREEDAALKAQFDPLLKGVQLGLAGKIIRILLRSLGLGAKSTRSGRRPRSQTDIDQRQHRPIPPVRHEPMRGPDANKRPDPTHKPGREPEDPIRKQLPQDIPGFSEKDRPNLIWINPDQSDEVTKPFIVESRRGDERTEYFNERVVWWIESIARQVDEKNILHIAGSTRKKDGKRLAEKRLRPRERSGKREPIKQQKGASYPDLIYMHRLTKRRLVINTYDFRSTDPRRNPTTREMNAAIRIVYNSKNGDILLMIPKLRDRQTLDYGKHADVIEQLIRQLGKHPPKLDPRDVNSPKRLIRFIRFPEETP